MALLPAFYIFTIFFLLHHAILGQCSKGFSINLIHRDSPDSPLYPGNLTFAELAQRMVHQSEARLLHLHRSTRLGTHTAKTNNHASHYRIDQEIIRTEVSVDGESVFLAKIVLGTFSGDIPHSTYYLEVDTASELIWLQCEDCETPPHQCWDQQSLLFKSSLSSSYHPLICNNNSMCYPDECIGDYCKYSIKYADNSSSTGVLAYENFLFESEPTIVTIPLVFGCGIDSIDEPPGEAPDVAGILGLGRGPRSLINQIRSQTDGKFSYCFFSRSSAVQNTYLRFGDDIPIIPNPKSTPILQTPQVDNAYQLDLIGITVDFWVEHQLPASRFIKIQANANHVCVIDSGSSITHFDKAVYMPLRQLMVDHFSRIPGIGPASIEGFDLCFDISRVTVPIPLLSITFEFQNNADLLVTGLFFRSHLLLCTLLGPSPIDGITLLGAYQQINHRFIYDLQNSVLLFGPEDCQQNA